MGQLHFLQPRSRVELVQPFATCELPPSDILNAQGINRQGPDPTVDSLFNGLLRKDNADYSALQVAPALFSQNAPSNRNGGAFSLGNVPRVTGEVRNFRFYNEDVSIIKNLHYDGALYLPVEG